MADGGFNPVLRHIRRLADDGDSGHLSDRDLLRLFAERGEEAAFSVLVDRHGPLVLGVCKRVLRHQQDAEDAMQATFLVLARKASSVPWHESVGNWLYGVAHRVSLKLRSTGARRREREQKAGEVNDAPHAEAPSEAAWGELKGVLDEELGRLPRHYREPLLLCYLQDRTQEEAAKLLGWSLGAVRGRLFRGREMLRRRLAARGLALSAALFAVVLVQSGAKASVPGVLIQATTRSAAAFAAGSLAASPIRLLAEGVLQTMFWNKVKTVTASLLALAIVCTGTGMLLHRALAARPPEVIGQIPAGGVPQRPAFAPPDEKDPDEVDEIEAVVKAVDAAKNLLIVVLDDEMRETAYDALNAKINVCGKDGKIGDLKPGMHCALTTTANNTTLKEIKAGWPTLQCELKQADAGKGTVIVAVEANNQTFDLTLQLEKDAKVTVGDLSGSLADVPEGGEVELQLTADKKGAFLIEARRPPGEVPAILKSVNAGKRLLMVTVEIDDPIDLAFDVAANAKVRITGKDGTLDGLKEGMRVDLKLAEDRKTVIGVRADVAPPADPGDK